MSGNRGCVMNSLLFLVIVFVPVLGHIIETVMVFEDEHSPAGTILWLVVIWTTPVIGPLIYLLFGQKRRRVMFGQPYYAQPYQQPAQQRTF
jgi:Phospholipase_D-nuclease N-terminal